MCNELNAGGVGRGGGAKAQKSALYVAWYSEGQERPGIQLAISENGGASFARPHIVSADILDATHPRLSVSEDGRILLTFQGRLAHEETKWRLNQAFMVEINGDSFTRPMQVRTLNIPFTIPMCSREPPGACSWRGQSR